MTRRPFALGLLVLVLLGGCGPETAPVDVVPKRSKRETVGMPAVVSTHGDPVQGDVAIQPAALDAGDAANRRDMRALADALAKAGDAEALALAALFRTSGLPPVDGAGTDEGRKAAPKPDPKVRDWLDTAERQAPDDVVALVVAIHLERFDEARRQALIARWRALEPDNLVPLLHARLPEAALLDATASTSVYDSHYDDFLRAVFTNLARPTVRPRLRLPVPADMPPEEVLAGQASNIWYSISEPSLDQISKPCLIQPLAEERQVQCRRLAGVLALHSDSALSEVLGLGMTKRFAKTPSEVRDIEERKRTLRWITACSSASYERDPRTHMKRYAKIVTSFDAFTEQSMMRRLALEAGYSPTPPPGWQPGQSP